MSIQLSGALVQVLAGALFVAVLVLIVMRISGRSGTRTAVLLPLISQWLGAYVLWAFVGGLAHQHGLLRTYHPRPFAVLALIGGALQYRAVVHGTRWQARDVFLGGQLFWLALLIVQNGVSAFSGAAANPQILSGFGDWLGAEGFPRIEGSFPHSGVDVAGHIGSPVVAAADGLVTVARDSRNTCGLIIVIEHQPYGYRTVKAHARGITAGVERYTNTVLLVDVVHGVDHFQRGVGRDGHNEKSSGVSVRPVVAEGNVPCGISSVF